MYISMQRQDYQATCLTGQCVTMAMRCCICRATIVAQGVRSAHSGSRSRPQSAWVGRRQALLKGTLLSGAVLTMALIGGPRRVAASTTQPPTIEQILEHPEWPDQLPFGAEDFQRYDESSDKAFYSQPRFVAHIDDGAISALSNYYGQVLPPSGSKDAAVLDMCSSWISHYPKGYTAGRVSGTGMNEEELKRNPVLTDYTVRDLNTQPELPYEDNTFDVITNTVSVDYLNRPMEVFKEMHRVLKPGGLAVMAFSNRCFPTKAISLWSATGDVDHAWIIGAYYHYSVPGGWTPPKAKDISPAKGLFGGGDPMYVAYANKKPA